MSMLYCINIFMITNYKSNEVLHLEILLVYYSLFEWLLLKAIFSIKRIKLKKNFILI